MPRARAPKPYDPLAPVRIPTLQEILAQLGPAFGPIMNDKQISARASALVNPQIASAIKAITDQITRRQAASASAIQQATQGYANAISSLPGNVAGDYERAGQQRATANAALASFLAGAGQSNADELAAKLGQIGAPQASKDMAAGASSGAGAYNAGAAAAGGTADLNRIYGQGAAAVGFAHTLPGLVALRGEQTLNDVSRQYAGALADQIGSIRGQVPKMIADIAMQLMSTRDAKKQAKLTAALSYLNQLRTNESTKATVAYGYAGKQYAADSASARAAAGNATREDIAAKNRANQKWIAQLGADTRVAVATATQGSKATTQQKNKTYSAFQSAAKSAAAMKAGTYGGGGGGQTVIGYNKKGDPVYSKKGGQKLSYDKAYRAVYNYLHAQLSDFIDPFKIKQLTVRALRAGGYTGQGAGLG